jgi:hypothetical protein
MTEYPYGMDRDCTLRFWNFVIMPGQGEPCLGCWKWAGSRNEQGYGGFRTPSGLKKAHRVAYELAIGPIPDGLVLDHICRRPHCVNPCHLEPVTQAENLRRAAMQRTCCPQGHPYTPDNTYYYKGKGRQCRTCTLAKQAEKRSRRTPEQRERARAYFRNRRITPEQRAAKNAQGRARRAEQKARKDGDRIAELTRRQEAA